MLGKSLSKKVLVVGTDYRGKGGIATVINDYRQIFEQFNFVCTHKFVGRFHQVLLVICAYWKIIWFCLFKGIKIVHIHTASYRSFYVASICVLLAKCLGKRVIFHLHGGDFESFFLSKRRFCLFVTKRVDVVVAVSKYLGQMFERLGLNDNIRVIYNMIALPPSVMKRYSSEEGKIKILFLGMLNCDKGFFEILEMLAQHLDEVKKKFILYVGGIGEIEKFNRCIQRYQLQDVVIYCGWLLGEDKKQKFLDVDIYIQPSHFESLGIAIIEAMSYGLPVLATKVGGIPELVEDNVNGFLVDVGNMNMLYEYLELFYNNRKLVQCMGKRAIEKAKIFGRENIEKQIIELYMSIL